MKSLLAALLAFALVLSACQAGPAATAPSASPSRAVAAATTAPTATPVPTPTPKPTPTPEPDYTSRPIIAQDPEGLIAQILTADKVVRDPAAKGPRLVWHGHVLQLATSQLNSFPEWKEQVFAAIPANTRAMIEGNLKASAELKKIHGPVAQSLPDWTIVDPPPPDELYSFYKKSEETFGVPWYYLAAINLVESRMGRIRGNSYAGAQGPMQFIPSTWAAYGQGDVNDHHDAIMAAGRYLRAAGAPGDMPRALFAYNHSYAYVAAITHYAEVMKADPNTFRAYYGWQVYYTWKEGTEYLPVGWKKD